MQFPGMSNLRWTHFSSPFNLFEGYFSLNDFHAWDAWNGQNSKKLRLIHMYLATESSQSGPFVIDDYFLIVFIRRAPVEDNTAQECIRTVATTYGCKILQLYQYDVNVYGYDAKCE